jgi:phosphoribosylanthranilate isomerase
MTIVSTTIIKICGITTVENAQLAIDAGADWLGVILVPNTPRTVVADALLPIAQLTRAKGVRLVGVFQNQPIELVNALAERLQLQYIQLHGDESPAYCQQCIKPVIKVFPLEPFPMAEQLLPYKPFIEYALLDLPKGVKTVPHWKRYPIKGLQQAVVIPLLLAGKLTATTVAGVVTQYSPVGVDVASGVETALVGQKDAQQLQLFVQAVRSAS